MPVRVVLGAVSLVAILGCAGAAPAPEPPPVPVVEAAPEPVPVLTFEAGVWPTFAFPRLPVGATVALPDVPASVAVDVRRPRAIVARADGSLASWDFAAGLIPLGVDGVFTEVVPDPFGDGFWVVGRGEGSEWTLGQLTLEPKPAVTTVYRSDGQLHHLIAPAVWFDGAPRLFVGRLDGEGQARVLGIRRDGGQVYEVTCPSGALGDWTDPAIRARALAGSDSDEEQPRCARLSNAWPVGMRAENAELLVSSGSDVTAIGYDVNWGTPREIHGMGGGGRLSPVGWYVLSHGTQGDPTEFYRPNGTRAGSVGAFEAFPASSADGRFLVGPVRKADGLVLEVVPVTVPLSSARGLTRFGLEGAELAQVEANGMLLADTQETQLWDYWNEVAYSDNLPPMMASIDGFSEVLAAGFDAVFMLGERSLSLPRLDALFGALTAAQGDRLARVREIAEVGRQLHSGEGGHPEVQAVLAGGRGHSALLGQEIDYRDFAPRGSYQGHLDLERYFRAFKWLDAVVLDEEERSALARDPAVLAAWKAWVEVQAPFLAGSRRPTWFGESKPPTWVRPECVPKRVREAPPKAYPLAWGLDSEILESTTFRRGVAVSCTVPHRYLPSGLDLLVGLGSREAQRLSAPDYSTFPELDAVHRDLAARWTTGVGVGDFASSWLRLVQLLAVEDTVPEGVSPAGWRRRLMETALASWTSYRHTTVLVTEASSAEAGGGFYGFEALTLEPSRGVVDPVPAAWEQVASLLDRLDDKSERRAPDGVRAALADAARQARAFGDMARRQVAGEALSNTEYDEIRAYGRAIEHPTLLFRGALRDDQALALPDPVPKIVDVHTTGPLEGADDLDRQPVLQGMGQAWLHAAIGRPQRLTVLLGDRGGSQLVRGSVYSYHEVIAAEILDDERWRRDVDRAERPAWAASRSLR